MKIGIVICAWNCVDQVETAVRSGFETCIIDDMDFKILVHDDHSEMDNINAACRDWNYPYTEYLKQKERMGLTVAWNTGITWALDNGMDGVVLCNQDIQFVPGWARRFAKDLETCPALSPLSNSPGVHSDKRSLQGQDVRNYLPEYLNKDIEPDDITFKNIMKRIGGNKPVQAEGIKGFFLGFRTDWLHKNRLAKDEYYDLNHKTANNGVGGSENEIFRRTGVRPWIATDMYIHHFKDRQKSIGRAREVFRTSK